MNANALNQISHDELKQKLSEGIVTFFFKKKDGTLRPANGTTKLTNIPESNHPKGTGVPKAQTVYFDLQKQAWRSVSLTKEIWLV